jgi:hypothetical protein
LFHEAKPKFAKNERKILVVPVDIINNENSKNKLAQPAKKGAAL